MLSFVKKFTISGLQKKILLPFGNADINFLLSFNIVLISVQGDGIHVVYIAINILEIFLNHSVANESILIANHRKRSVKLINIFLMLAGNSKVSKKNWIQQNITLYLISQTNYLKQN